MELSSPVAINLDLLQLSPTMYGLSYHAEAVADHAETVRDTYTVPANRMAIVSTKKGKIVAFGGAASPSAHIMLKVTPSGGAAETIFTVGTGPLAQNAEVSEVDTESYILSAGDKLDLSSYQNMSTTCVYKSSVAIIEIDQP